MRKNDNRISEDVPEGMPHSEEWRRIAREHNEVMDELDRLRKWMLIGMSTIVAVVVIVYIVTL